MSTELYCSNIHSHSNTFFINASLPSSKMQNISSERGEPLLKKLMRKKAQIHENAIKSKPFKNFNKKPFISAEIQDAKELLKENKCKSTNTHSNKKMCYCSPTTHEGSFKCSTTTKSTTEKNNVMKCSKFKPQLSRFGRVANSAEVGSHNSLIQPSGLESF
uniref:Uncharacterized protein LOC113785673 n=1 Tax=Cicer arietinum TaxID=3827 RepID=A0A3Q7XMN4_CICAR|nr:uncharacterized protein LOC113785673 [Cicer arietinum]